jgi:hypothetical protein
VELLCLWFSAQNVFLVVCGHICSGAAMSVVQCLQCVLSSMRTHIYLLLYMCVLIILYMCICYCICLSSSYYMCVPHTTICTARPASAAAPLYAAMYSSTTIRVPVGLLHMRYMWFISLILVLLYVYLWDHYMCICGTTVYYICVSAALYVYLWGFCSGVRILLPICELHIAVPL